MKPVSSFILMTSTVLLAACSASTPAVDTAASTPAPAEAPTASAPTPATPAAETTGDAVATDSARAGAPADHSPEAGTPSAASDDAMKGTVQAGWYSNGTFRACGESTGMKVDKAGEIDQKIKAAGMSASDPVYVKLEGMAMDGGYMVTNIAQVGSSAPVRDCPMAGTTTQTGG